MRETTEDAGKRGAGRHRSTKRAAHSRTASTSSTFEEDFGPGPDEGLSGAPSHDSASRAPGPIPGLACAGEDCVLKPAADLISRFALNLGKRGHGVSLSRAALSGIELMKALRDFLDEEITLAEKSTGGGAKPRRYSKIRVE